MNNFDLASEALLVENGLNIDVLDSALVSMHTHQLDFAEVYLESVQGESWGIEDGIVKDGSFAIDQGLGVRGVSGEKTGFAYADEISLAALTKSAKAARSISAAGNSQRVQAHAAGNYKSLYTNQSPLNSLTEIEKIQMLHAIDQEARKLDPRVTQVMASINGSYAKTLVMASDGTLAGDVLPMCRINIMVMMEEDGRIEKGFSGGGGRTEYTVFGENDLWKTYTHEAVRLAQVALTAKPAPAGAMDVVLGGGWPGILLHEAVGHGLEGDFNRKGVSSFSGLMGEKVASDLCTVVDDGTLPDRRGSLTHDDEGTPSAYNVLIEKGVLKSYMQDKLNAKLMGVKPTGNGRRQSYAHIPMPRMTNTYMLPGKHEKNEIIESIEKGIYAANFSGGQVDITSGKFVFVCNEAYLVENGKIKHALKDATIIGDGPSALKEVSMVGNDLELDQGVGVCGKDGQSVPVGVGMPTIRINGLTIGGTE